MKSYSSQVNKRNNGVTVSDVITAKQDHAHNELFDVALAKYLSYSGLDESSYSFVELKGSYFDSPSRVQVISMEYPYTRTIVDLTPFWEDYCFDEKISYLKLDNEMTVETSEIIYRDYARGYAELRSKMTGRIYKVSLKDLDKSIPDVEDEISMPHTFGYKLKNRIYGQDRYGVTEGFGR
jgi:hypothetical protein